RVLFRSKTSLCCGTVGCSTQSRNDLAKHSIIDIHAALPSNSIRVDIERIAVVDMIIDQCCQCVGSSSNGVKVAREVQVDVFHGHNLGESPPAAPPLSPITGPWEGSRIATIDFLPRRFSASVKPMRTVDLPSPAGVGETPVTKTNLPAFSGAGSLVTSTFALFFPYGISASAGIPTLAAISAIGRSLWAWAISTSLRCLVIPSIVRSGFYCLNTSPSAPASGF